MIIQKIEPVPEGYYPPFTQEWLQNPSKFENLYPNGGNRLEGLLDEIKSKFSPERRNLLVATLLKQYGNEITPEIRMQIELLGRDNVFTVTTGQQIHPFLGPLYVIYKIWSVVETASDYNRMYPGNLFIPVFWMATEDHDFDEIKEIKALGDSYEWFAEGVGGPVGRLNSGSLKDIIGRIAQKLESQPEKQERFLNIASCYLDTDDNTLADSSRRLINRLFKEQGLLIIDPDDLNFKRQFAHHIKSEIDSEVYYNAFLQDSRKMREMGFQPQVNPRRTHLFFLKENKRIRLDYDRTGIFKLAGTEIEAGTNELLELADTQPEMFSPNALFRPLYQQAILPNAAYICGPSEIIYWNQTYSAFLKADLPAPILKLRDSYLILDEKIYKQIQETGIEEAVLWQGYDAASTQLTENLLEGNEFKSAIHDFSGIADKILKAMYSYKIATLKEWKQEFEELRKKLNAEHNAFSEGIMNSEKFAHYYHRLRKVFDRYYNKKQPQERTEHWISYYINSGFFKKN